MSNIKHSFKYIKRGRVKKPLIPIQLRLNGKVVSSLALIDSGADFNIFHSDLAPILGIDLSKLKTTQFGGIKKGVPDSTAYIAALEVGVNGDFFDCPVLFSADISPNGYGVVGQLGFFDHFRITFDYDTDHIYLKK